MLLKMSSKRLQFPNGFMWGTATAAYQIEGAASEHREQCIWDRFCATPGMVINGDSGAVACDHYHRFRSDVVDLIKPLNTKYYRFSIAWPRIQKFSEDSSAPVVNEHGIAFYNGLIDVLLENDITPVVTLYHWDMPAVVHDRHGGWPGKASIAQAFADYAEICFRSFGDRVKWWITLNEPWCSAFLGYDIGIHAPGDSSAPGIFVYRAAHNLLLAHAQAVDLYRKKFAPSQGGCIGITFNTMWFEPARNDEACKSATSRCLDFELGWFADPVYTGDYPQSMREIVGDRLPKFSTEESELLRGSSDFFGLNYYSTTYIEPAEKRDETEENKFSYESDRCAQFSSDDSWPSSDMGWTVVPWGLQRLLEYIQTRYSPPGGIIITENGIAVSEPSLDAAMGSETRIDFYSSHISAVHAAITGEVKADVRGYFLWSLMDNFEWSFGYGKRFGLYYVNYKTLERSAKPAVKWYADVVSENALTTCS